MPAIQEAASQPVVRSRSRWKATVRGWNGAQNCQGPDAPRVIPRDPCCWIRLRQPCDLGHHHWDKGGHEPEGRGNSAKRHGRLSGTYRRRRAGRREAQSFSSPSVLAQLRPARLRRRPLENGWPYTSAVIPHEQRSAKTAIMALAIDMTLAGLTKSRAPYETIRQGFSPRPRSARAEHSRGPTPSRCSPYRPRRWQASSSACR
jgi:hypothetical protein